ncbi:branched-chain amino acid ABC transporter permease [Stackebrandtia nassauensis]|uniref:Inner-membrane translocator n=1 Tax=Stackebrandtia nassauensis (strain DSM 44728 / CIP 108903 / NRRL B-16338 / NBRC 102104 / LLR-40K-21) TaxID=446470 RepID=D3PX08_STANL|nr:branched-chain amino acid ABC transporter permease [Stackebrandtia nassauensis]ADD45232.1 inner-membrane translocator [Stackebrandtia nassauensis DSM 44728]
MLQQLANGLFSGAIYALFAIGFTLVFGILRHLNLAHAAIYTAGALIGIELVEGQGLPLWLAFPLAILAGTALGLILERSAFRPLAGRRDEHFAGLISSVAFGGMLIALLQARFGSEPRSFSQSAFPNEILTIAGVTVSLAQLLTLGLALALMLGLAWLLSKSALGRAMRAVAENPRAARVLGINVEGVTAGTYALSSALGSCAGVLMALNVGQGDLRMGLSIELTGFAVIILGGLGSLWGAMAAGLLLGFAEAFTVHLIDSTWKNVVAFVLLFVILLTRPQGLFGQVKTREV